MIFVPEASLFLRYSLYELRLDYQLWYKWRFFFESASMRDPVQYFPQNVCQALVELFPDINKFFEFEM